MTTNRQIGHLIIDEIIKQRMVSAVFDGHGYVFTWAGSAPEQLEALVHQYYQKRPMDCELLWQNGDGSKEELIAHKIIKELSQAERLNRLSHRALIEEACSQGLGENLVVIELMNRVLPGWEK